MNTTVNTDSLLKSWPTQGNGDGYNVPYGIFTETDVYNEEQKRIFRGPNWSFVGLEAEIVKSGDFKSTFIGDTPVVVMRDEDGDVHVVVNRCAHRGAKVCRSLRGNTPNLECVYHSWAYNLKGDLIGVPFRRGVKGNGGMPASFDMKEHSLQKLRVDTYKGLIFASFSDTVESLPDYLGETACQSIDRIFNRPIKVLGDQRQRIFGNWKLYAENTRDPYHASLLHMFHNTFGLYRATQKGGCELDDKYRHSMLWSSKGTSSTADDAKIYKDNRAFNSEFTLQDPSVLAGKPDFDDDITVVILALFPNVIVQQISNTLAVRQIVTYGPKEFELVWTSFGYADDDHEMDVIRSKQSNLIGPAGLISMEDGEAVELVHDGIIRDQDQFSYMGMGGGEPGASDHLVTESSIIGFWEYYRDIMGQQPA